MKVITIPSDGPCTMTDDSPYVIVDLITHVIDGPVTYLQIPSTHPIAPDHYLMISEKVHDTSIPINAQAMRVFYSFDILPMGFIRGAAVLCGPAVPIGSSVCEKALDFLLPQSTLRKRHHVLVTTSDGHTWQAHRSHVSSRSHSTSYMCRRRCRDNQHSSISS